MQTAEQKYNILEVHTIPISTPVSSLASAQKVNCSTERGFVIMLLQTRNYYYLREKIYKMIKELPRFVAPDLDFPFTLKYVLLNYVILHDFNYLLLLFYYRFLGKRALVGYNASIF